MQRATIWVVQSFDGWYFVVRLGQDRIFRCHWPRFCLSAEDNESAEAFERRVRGECRRRKFGHVHLLDCNDVAECRVGAF